MTSSRNIEAGRPGVIAASAGERGISFFRYKALPLFVATIYAFTLASLPIDHFLDRANYFLYARNSWLIALNYSLNPISYFTNEPLWLLINTQLYSFLDEFTITRLFIFFPAFFTVYVVGSRERLAIPILILMLLVPGIIQNYIVHIRQGVAIAIFLAGYYAKDRRLKYALIALSPFVHSGFFIISPIFFINEFFSRFCKIDLRIRLALFAAAFVLVAIFIEVIMSSASVRQTDEYRDVSAEISGLGFVFWLSILALFFSQGWAFIERSAFPILMLTFYLMIYFLVPFAGRVIECVLIPIFAAGVALRDWRRIAFLGGILLYSVAFYYSTRDMYWFGWGI